ncbi:hypothetical protein [Sulfodiicoccus acidiphilus]|uniref:hypothetical protein n=1 Tax=Sulfodiicoccus acidiphilus TaxID=1670455 RepID=UPI000F828B0D|nr:hypothetical protein [Sulfodiicoccus acidiphilus]
MPYLDRGVKVCRPREASGLWEGEVVFSTPITLLTENGPVVFPPLSKVGEECTHKTLAIAWADGIIWREGLVEGVEGEVDVQGEVEVLDTRLIPAFAFRKIVGRVKVKVGKIPGVPLIKVEDLPLISFFQGRLFEATRSLMPLLRLLSASILYYYLRNDESLVQEGGTSL